MKKKLSIFLIMVFLLSTFCITSNATEENREDSENIREVFINSTFKEKTEEGYYVFTSEESPATAYSLCDDDPTAPKTKTHSAITIVPLDKADTELWDSTINDTTRSSGGNKYAYAWDSTRGIKIFSTIYYTESTSGGRTFTKLDKITGGYERADYTLSIVSQKVTYGATDGGTQQSNTVTVTGNSWTLTPPSSWKPIDTGQSIVRILGANTTVSIKRNANPWTVELLNNLYSNIL